VPECAGILEQIAYAGSPMRQQKPADEPQESLNLDRPAVLDGVDIA
jgi:hypothetical protein